MAIKATQLCLGAVLAVSAGMPSAAPVAPCRPPPFDVGYRVMSVAGTTAGVWYPTSNREAPHTYAENLRGAAALNGAVERCERFPLVVFSHGFGGCGIQTVFFTEELARRGYIVAAPDHKDAAVCSVSGKGTFRAVQTDQSFLAPQDWTEHSHADRRDDLRGLISAMLESPDFRGAIAPDRVGAVGHSLGGYAVLGIAGAWPGWKDDRVRAVLAVSPWVAPFLRDNRLKSMRAAIMYQGAQGDWGITPSLRGKSGAFALSNAPKYYAELKAGNHFIWTNLECGNKTVARCLESDKTARLINDYGIAFLDRHVKGDSRAMSGLNGGGLASFQRAR